MRPELYWIDVLARGRLALAPKPRGGEWLSDELAEWRQAGVELVVSLLTDSEITELELEGEEDAARLHDMQFIRFPIEDRSVPSSRADTLALLRTLSEFVRTGKGVCIHCRMGIGRSSLIAAGTMMQMGIEPATAFSRIESARGLAVPDTVEQRTWVFQLR